MSWNRFSTIRLIVLGYALASLLLAGCGKRLSESDVAYAGPILDNILAGIAARDYDKFSRDFSKNMKDAVPQADFEALLETLDEKLGSYQERTFSSATQTKSATDLMVITYRARYSKEEDVTIRLYLSERGGKQSIEGFLIDSPALKQ